MIDESEIAATVSRMWLLHQDELATFDNIHEFVKGERGRPSLPPNASAEVKEIGRNCVHNVLTLVLDAFVQNLSVVGFRSVSDDANNAAWERWQQQQMDARQAEIYSSAVKYGAGYVIAAASGSELVFKPRSPRQLIAIYSDARVDRWPQYALETWIDTTDAKPRRRGTFYDDVYRYPLDLGATSVAKDDEGQIRRSGITLGEDVIGDAEPHGGRFKGEPVCPVVRYINRRDAEDLVEGEIERLIPDQRAINEVNFDRLIVARFGAFPQKVITGWTGASDEVLKMSAARALTFDDETVKAFTLTAASLEPYNSLLEEMMQHVATRAQVSPAYIVGKLVNLSAEALAAAEANQQRKLAAMRESHGESHEQLLGLAAEMTGGEVDDAAEVVWKDTEARSFGAIVDGILKLGQSLQSGAPIGPLLPLVPGLTPQMVERLEQGARASQAAQLTAALLQRPKATVTNGGVGAGAQIPAPASQPFS